MHTHVLYFQNLTGIEKIVLRSKRNLGGTGKEVKLWELLHPWEEETGDLWQMGQVMMRAYDNEDFKLSFTVYKANSSEGYVALDDVVILMKEVCDSLPAYAEPVPASSETSDLRIIYKILLHCHFSRILVHISRKQVQLGTIKHRGKVSV